MAKKKTKPRKATKKKPAKAASQRKPSTRGAARREAAPAKKERMTEAKWMACNDPQAMLEFLRGKVSDRKLRLFIFGCGRRVWHRLIDERSQKAVTVGERFVEGKATQEEREAAMTAVLRDRQEAAEADSPDSGAVDIAVASVSADMAAGVALAVEGSYRQAYNDLIPSITEDADLDSVWGAGVKEAKPSLVQTLRDIFGNPFRPVSLDPGWLTSTVQNLATAIYTHRAFDRLPILADALEDAGCTNADILTHCRQPGEHCRGCWVVDLLLDKR